MRNRFSNNMEFGFDKKQVYSLICFGVALFLFLFASVDKIRLVGSYPEDLTSQKALEVAKKRGLWPVFSNFRMPRYIDSIQNESGYYLVRYVGVAYMGNILVMTIFLVVGLLLRVQRPIP